MTLDGNGALYGTTSAGGANACGCGTVYKLTPPAPGQSRWSGSLLHSFGGADGSLPWGPMLADGSGALYGATVSGGANSQGAVFKLSPPQGGQTTWTESVLYSFKGGSDGSSAGAGLITDATGALYGTTLGGGPGYAGTVFKLTPPGNGQTTWTETVLTSFPKNGEIRPHGGLIEDANGMLWGATEQGGAHGDGTIFSLTQ